MSNVDLIDALAAGERLSLNQLEQLLGEHTADDRDYAEAEAYRATIERFGHVLTTWGTLDVTSHCRQDCRYCGIAHSADGVERYRLTPSAIQAACAEGHQIGFRHFFLQGGDDPDLTDDLIESLVFGLKTSFPDSTVCLSFGPRPKASFERYAAAGADRYVLRHETADADHFAQLHPSPLTWAGRQQALHDLREAGLAVGAGMMVGSPFQTAAHRARDLDFLAEFKPEIAMIGPYLPASASALGAHPKGSISETVYVLALARLILPSAFIPAVTAMATIHRRGRELAVMAGANVCLPNLTPESERGKYAVYDNKVTAGPESARGLDVVRRRMADISYALDVDQHRAHGKHHRH